MINEKRFKNLRSLEAKGIFSFNKLFFSILKDIEKEIFTEKSYRLDDFKLKYSYSVEKKETKEGTIYPISNVILRKYKIDNKNSMIIYDSIEFFLTHIREDDYYIENISLMSNRNDFIDKRMWNRQGSETVTILMKLQKDYYDWIFRPDHTLRINSIFDTSRVFCRDFCERKLFDIAFIHKSKEYMLSHLLRDINIDTEKLCIQDKEIEKWPFILEDILSANELALLEMHLV